MKIHFIITEKGIKDAIAPDDSSVGLWNFETNLLHIFNMDVCQPHLVRAMKFDLVTRFAIRGHSFRQASSELNLHDPFPKILTLWELWSLLFVISYRQL